MALLQAVGVVTPCDIMAYGAGSESASAHPRSVEDAIAGALANVRSRYRERLDRLGLTESYFDETGGICDLMLLDVGSWTKYQIVYYRVTGDIEWPRIMPKNVAEDIMQDRIVIHGYEKSLGNGNAKKGARNKDATRSTSSAKTVVKPARRNRPKPKQFHKEPVPTAAAQAHIDAALKSGREAAAAYERNRSKPPLAQSSDLRQMAELKRKGMSGDEIASRFGIERVKQYNKAHPESPIRTSKHSKPGAPGFSW